MWGTNARGESPLLPLRTLVLGMGCLATIYWSTIERQCCYLLVFDLVSNGKGDAAAILAAEEEKRREEEPTGSHSPASLMLLADGFLLWIPRHHTLSATASGHTHTQVLSRIKPGASHTRTYYVCVCAGSVGTTRR
jgi:hypothetical protein